MIIHISHGADPDNWFVVEPSIGKPRTSVAGTPITHEMAVASLLNAGRTVYELETRPFSGPWMISGFRRPAGREETP